MGFTLRRSSRKVYLPRWCNGSVFVLHAKGGGSIPSRGTNNKGRINRNLVAGHSVKVFSSESGGSSPSSPTNDNGFLYLPDVDNPR